MQYSAIFLKNPPNPCILTPSYEPPDPDFRLNLALRNQNLNFKITFEIRKMTRLPGTRAIFLISKVILK